MIGYYSNLSSGFPVATQCIFMGWMWLVVALGVGTVRLVTCRPRLEGHFFGACAIAVVITLAASTIVLIEGLVPAVMAQTEQERLSALAVAGAFSCGPFLFTGLAAGLLCTVFLFGSLVRQVKP